MMSSSENMVNDVSDELEEMKLILLQERDLKTVQFLNVLQVGCLLDRHSLPCTLLRFGHWCLLF